MNEEKTNGGSVGGGASPASAESFENILKKESREEMLSKMPQRHTVSPHRNCRFRR